MATVMMRSGLPLLAALLALWLLLGFLALSNGLTIAVALLMVLALAAALRRQYRLPVPSPAELSLPPDDYPGAVVLVCGDSTLLFTAGRESMETRQAWYLQAGDVQRLAPLIGELVAARPSWLGQLSLLQAIMPERHTSAEQFAQDQREWQRAIRPCLRVSGWCFPFWQVSWVTPLSDQGPGWFAVAGGAGMQRFSADRDPCDLADGSATACATHRDPPRLTNLPVTAVDRQKRLSQRLWLDHLLEWQARFLTPHSQLLPCVAGFCFSPLPAVSDNLWQSHTRAVTTLPAAVAAERGDLPLPDPLIPALPRPARITRPMRDALSAAALCGLFLLLAMLASYYHNQRLTAEIGDRLVRWSRPSLAAEPRLRLREQLIADRTQLENWQRGEPQRYGVGLYQGMRLLPLVEAAINGWAPPAPPAATAERAPDVAPVNIRLDSLALFTSGSASLKPGSTRVLVQALTGIRARPGWQIAIGGHTDNTGTAALNQQLSLRRAEAVRDWLRDNGELPQRCLSVRGYGDSQPQATNDTPQGRAANRRVEISLIPQACAAEPGLTAPPDS